MSFASAGHTNLQPRPSTPMSLQLLFLASSSITCTQSAEDGSPIPTQVLPSCTFTITPLLTKVKFTDWPITYLHTHCPPPPRLAPTLRNTAANCSRDMLSPSAFLLLQGSIVSEVLWQPVNLLCRRHYYLFIWFCGKRNPSIKQPPVPNNRSIKWAKELKL